VLLLVPARTYRAADFLLAAARMGLELVIASDGALPVGSRPVIPVNPGDPDASIRRLLARSGPVAAVVAADTPMLVLAAAVAARMRLPHNPVEAVRNSTDKARQRQRWAAAGVAQPAFRLVPAAAPQDAIGQLAAAVGFPCVVKAVSLSASQGILRADDPAAAVTAARRIRQVLAAAGRPAAEPVLIEEYLPGPELSIDGLLAGGDLTVTAVFDKPATPDGPTFEETLLVTPSRLPPPVLAAAIRTAGQAASALGQPVAAAGFGQARPCGVFMLPVPRPGVLRAVEGRAAAAAVPGITGLTITIPAGQQVLPLPDGDRYLGFIFAEAGTRQEVEQALTAAYDRLRIVIG
jgi:hypothetical protein